MFELRCRHVGFDCAGVVRGQTKDEVLQQAAAHAKEVHGTIVTPEMAVQVLSAIQVVAAPSRSATGKVPPSDPQG